MRLTKSPRLSQVSVKILEWGLPAVAGTLMYTAGSTAALDTYDAARLYTATGAMIEHALMSLLLIVGGALIADLAVRERHS